MQQIEEFEERHHGRGHIVGFGEDIWRIAERQALEDEIRGIEEQFRRPVHVPHPILEIFQGKFAAALHSEASALYQQNLYTREEIEDMVTAFPAVMHRATYKAIVESFRLCGAAYDEKAHLGEVLLADGTELAGADAGGLEEWNAKLKEILLLINEMPDAACENLLYYLCADEEAIHRVRPDLPPRASNPTLDRCFRLIIEFYTTFIAHHMPADSSALQQAFSLDEIS